MAQKCSARRKEKEGGREGMREGEREGGMKMRGRVR